MVMSWILENFWYIYTGITIVAFFSGGLLPNLDGDATVKETFWISVLFAVLWPLIIPVGLIYGVSHGYHKLMASIADKIKHNWGT